MNQCIYNFASFYYSYSLYVSWVHILCLHSLTRTKAHILSLPGTHLPYLVIIFFIHLATTSLCSYLFLYLAHTLLPWLSYTLLTSACFTYLALTSFTYFSFLVVITLVYMAFTYHTLLSLHFPNVHLLSLNDIHLSRGHLPYKQAAHLFCLPHSLNSTHLFDLPGDLLT